MGRQPGRDGRTWERVRAIVLAGSDVCGICGERIDMSLSGQDRMGPTVNHRKPLALGGAPYDLDNLEPAHRVCNSGLGLNELPTVRSREW